MEGRIIAVGLNPLLRVSLSITRGEVGTHLTVTLRSFSYAIHFGMSVVN